MKRLVLALLMLVQTASFAQNCGFTYATSPNGAVTFVPAGLSPTYVCSWSFGDGSSGMSMGTITHSYNSMGPFVVCLTATDSMTMTTCTFCDTVVMNSSSNCMFSMSQTPGTTSFIFSVTVPSGQNAVWTFGDNSNGIGTPVSHTYSSAGNYLVCVQLIDSMTSSVVCSSCINLVVQPVSQNCYFTFYADSLLPQAINFTAYPAYGGSQITWDFGDNTTATLSPRQHVYAQPGTYNVCMNETNSAGVLLCSNCQTVTVGSFSNQCNFTYSISPGAPSTSVAFFSTSNFPVYQYAWDFGNGSTMTGNVVTANFAAPGVYNVCMNALDSNGAILCSVCQPVVISPAPINCAAYFIPSIAGMNASFIELSTGTSSATSYSWSFGDGMGSALRFPSHIYSQPGMYQVCLSVSDSNCTDQYCTTVVADTTNQNPGPCQAQFVVLQVAPFDVVIIDLSSGTNLAYNWDFGDGTTSSQQYPSHYYTSTGSYTLCLTVSGGLLGCTSTFCDTLTVDSAGNVYRIMQGFNVNVVSPSSFTGLSDIAPTAEFRSYPNPVADQFTIEGASAMNQASCYRVLTLQGVAALSGALNSTKTSVNATSLAKGTYLLEIRDVKGATSYLKFVKE